MAEIGITVIENADLCAHYSALSPMVGSISSCYSATALQPMQQEEAERDARRVNTSINLNRTNLIPFVPYALLFNIQIQHYYNQVPLLGTKCFFDRILKSMLGIGYEFSYYS